jgi:D-alanyl-D-alanine carboxypeptidase
MNLIKSFACALLGLTGALAAADQARSPARAQLEAFLAAFNSGDRAKIEAFGRDHAPPDFVRPQIIDDTLKMFEATGGLDVVNVEESSPHALEGQVRERKTSQVQQLVLQVNPAAPHRITVIAFTGGPELVEGPK